MVILIKAGRRNFELCAVLGATAVDCTGKDAHSFPLRNLSFEGSNIHIASMFDRCKRAARSKPACTDGKLCDWLDCADAKLLCS
jgi:hypothetical protein